jgi:hypothetical protein
LQLEQITQGLERRLDRLGFFTVNIISLQNIEYLELQGQMTGDSTSKYRIFGSFAQIFSTWNF